MTGATFDPKAGTVTFSEAPPAGPVTIVVDIGTEDAAVIATFSDGKKVLASPAGEVHPHQQIVTDSLKSAAHRHMTWAPMSREQASGLARRGTGGHHWAAAPGRIVPTAIGMTLMPAPAPPGTPWQCNTVPTPIGAVVLRMLGAGVLSSPMALITHLPPGDCRMADPQPLHCPWVRVRRVMVLPRPWVPPMIN